MLFSPREILFSPTTQCNLCCPHCAVKRVKTTLSFNSAIRFLEQCHKYKINKIGFTGGEPFIDLDFLYSVIRFAVAANFNFSNITTNGVWFKHKQQLQKVLTKLYDCGYDGSFYLSVDSFHKQSITKLVCFIETALTVWSRPDIISILTVRGENDAATQKVLKALANALKARFLTLANDNDCIKNNNLFIKIIKINLSAVGRASKIKNPWGKQWFKDDFCRGPGNIFFVDNYGDVKPCCGYANDLSRLTIGNVKHDSVKDMLINFKNNHFTHTIFSSGLTSIRKAIEDSGFKFPGKTDDICYFCGYLQENAARLNLEKIIEKAKNVVILKSVCSKSLRRH